MRSHSEVDAIVPLGVVALDEERGRSGDESREEERT